MRFLPLVWAALWRKPVEALLICLAITAAFSLFGLMLGLNVTYQRIVDSSRMDRLFVNKRFTVIDGPRMPIGMRQTIIRIPGVAAAGLYDPLNGYYQDPHNFVRVIGVDQEMRRAWSELLSDAQWQLLFSRPTGVLVSRKMADKLKLKEGDVLPIITEPGMRADRSVAWQFHVLAIVPDDPTRVAGYILGNYDYIDRSRPLQEQGSAIEFRVAVNDPDRANEISLRIDEIFANSGTATITIPQKADYEISLRNGISAASVTWPVASAGIFMIFLVSANGIAQSVRQRLPEFAILSTLGYRSSTISLLVFLEAALPCVLGAVFGISLAASLTMWPIQYLPPELTNGPKPTFSPVVLALALAFALLLALVSSPLPIIRLRRMRVTDALSGKLG